MVIVLINNVTKKKRIRRSFTDTKFSNILDIPSNPKGDRKYKYNKNCPKEIRELVANVEIEKQIAIKFERN